MFVFLEELAEMLASAYKSSLDVWIVATDLARIVRENINIPEEVNFNGCFREHREENFDPTSTEN